MTDIDRYLKDAFDELAPKAEVPGFRPGRAPRKLVEIRFKEQVSNQVKGSLLMDSLGQVSEEHEFSAISEPDFDFDAVTLPEDGPLTFEFDIEVRPEFDVPQWKGLKLERPVREYSDEDVDEQPAATADALRQAGRTVTAACKRVTTWMSTSRWPTTASRSISAGRCTASRHAPTLSLRDATIEGFGELMVGAEKGETRKHQGHDQ